MKLKIYRRSVWIAIVVLLPLSLCNLLSAQHLYEVDATMGELELRSNHLRLGGSDPDGNVIGVNNYYITYNGRPFIPVMGEFHYTRYPHQYWEESIKKMKSGGINTISTYVFWILHEEIEGQFDWSEDRNLRAFLNLCKKQDMHVILRIGPFGHGEIRNGGLPDWLLGKPLNIRTNDSLYLTYADNLFAQIGIQTAGLYFKDGGPIIGVQIENEYQHSAAPWGLTYPGQPLDFTASERDRESTHKGIEITNKDNPYAVAGIDHLRKLKALARKHGIVAPLYTVTGWGNATIIPDESIPVTAAYAYPFWTPKQDLSPFFLYTDLHKTPDYSPVSYPPEDYPVLPVELGSGINKVYSRRPVVDQASFDAMINRCLGSGANGVGYYMFHSGSTPGGKNNFMNDEAFGLTKISYEYQGPIGEYGQPRTGYYRLRTMHYFLDDFGALLAPMQVALPPNYDKLKPGDVRDLRYAVRVHDDQGFLFVNNFQDDTTMADQESVRINIKTNQDLISVPEEGGFNLKSGESVIFPFNFDMGGVKLKYATAQLLMKGDDSRPFYIFFYPEETVPEFSFEKNTKVENILNCHVNPGKRSVLVKTTKDINEFAVKANGKEIRILVIPKSLALTAYKTVLNGKTSVIFSQSLPLPEEEKNLYQLLAYDSSGFNLSVYPKIDYIPSLSQGSISRLNSSPVFSSFEVKLPEYHFKVTTDRINSRKIRVGLPDQLPAGVHDLFLDVNYTGDTGMGFLDDNLVADDFYNGGTWQIGLRKFILQKTGAKDIVFYFRPIQGHPDYLADLKKIPDPVVQQGENGSFLSINKISFTPVYETHIDFSK